MKRLAIILLLALLTVHVGNAQIIATQADSVWGNPKAVKLKRIWSRSGTQRMEMGLAVANLGDLNQDGLGDFAVQGRKVLEIYLGGRPAPSSIPFQIIPDTIAMLSTRDETPIGDFWGTGHKAICLARGFDIVVFRTESGRLADTPAAMLTKQRTPTSVRGINGMTAVDVDRDGYDDLIVGSAAGVSSDVTDFHAQIWIFRGGPDFDLDEPDVVIRDIEENSDGGIASVRCGDIDGDGHLDLAFQSRYRPSYVGKLKIYFGNGRLDGFPSQPDRVAVNSSFRVFLTDVDGDTISDVLVEPFALFRSGSGKNCRERTYASSDADLIDSLGGWCRVLGPLNDSSGRFSMVGSLRSALRCYSGGPSGPDAGWDAWYWATADGFLTDNWNSVGTALGDVDGDGWNDVMFGDHYYPSEYMPGGIAIILAGGPYIPLDSIHDRPVVDRPVPEPIVGIQIRPLPATEHLNLTIGAPHSLSDLTLEVHDVLGRRVDLRLVPTGTTHVQLDCSHYPAGLYLLSLHSTSSGVVYQTTVPVLPFIRTASD